MKLGSNEERVIHEFCDHMQIPFDKIASENFSAFMRMLSLSKLLNPQQYEEKKPTAGVPWDDKEEKVQIAEKAAALLWVSVFSE